MKKYIKRLESLMTTKRPYLEHNLTLTSLAKRIGTNRTYLSIIFRDHYGTSFYGFVNSYRVQHAANLMKESDIIVRDAMTASGFYSYNSFRNAFLEAYGCRPGEYLKMIKEAKNSEE